MHMPLPATRKQSKATPSLQQSKFTAGGLSTCGDYTEPTPAPPHTPAAHPKGFRSTFGFNTNVWASLAATSSPHPAKDDPPPEPATGNVIKDATGKGLRLHGVASVFGPAEPMDHWQSQARPGIGIGLLECKNVGADHRVMFRWAAAAVQWLVLRCTVGWALLSCDVQAWLHEGLVS